MAFRMKHGMKPSGMARWMKNKPKTQGDKVTAIGIKLFWGLIIIMIVVSYITALIKG